MSSAFGLVKFEKTGNIYYGCYNGTTDIMLPYLCTPEECYNEKSDCYCAISYCNKLCGKHKTLDFQYSVSDLDDIEIYSNYGGGFYWRGTGSESLKMIKDYLMPYEQCWEDMKHDKPDWVKEFLENLDKG